VDSDKPFHGIPESQEMAHSRAFYCVHDIVHMGNREMEQLTEVKNQLKTALVCAARLALEARLLREASADDNFSMNSMDVRALAENLQQLADRTREAIIFLTRELSRTKNEFVQ
jgi:hypothetical protein